MFKLALQKNESSFKTAVACCQAPLHLTSDGILSAVHGSQREKPRQLGLVWFGLFRATSVAYGSSQARGRIRAAAAGLHHSHSNAGSEPDLQLTAPLMATWDPYPLIEARDWTCILMDTSWVHYHWATRGAPTLRSFKVGRNMVKSTVIHPLIHPFIHPPIHSFIHPSIHPSMHPCIIHIYLHTSCIYTSIPWTTIHQCHKCPSWDRPWTGCGDTMDEVSDPVKLML